MAKTKGSGSHRLNDSAQKVPILASIRHLSVFSTWRRRAKDSPPRSHEQDSLLEEEVSGRWPVARFRDEEVQLPLSHD